MKPVHRYTFVALILKYAMATAVVIAGISALFLSKRPSLGGGVAVGSVLVGVCIFSLPIIRRTLSRDYVLLNRSIMRDRLDGLEQKIHSVGVRVETRKAFMTCRNELLYVERFSAVEKFACWDVVREKLASLIETFNQVELSVNYEIAVEEMARKKSSSVAQTVGVTPSR